MWRERYGPHVTDTGDLRSVRSPGRRRARDGAGKHNVAVFGLEDPAGAVTPDTVARSLMEGIRSTLERYPESIRVPMP